MLVSDLVVDTGGADRKEIAAIADIPVVSAELDERLPGLVAERSLS